MRLIFVNFDSSTLIGSISRQITAAFQAEGVEPEVVEYVALAEQVKAQLGLDQAQAKARVATVLCDQLKGAADTWLLALNGRFLPAEVFVRLRAGGVRIADWELDEPYCVDASLKVSRHCDRLFSVDSSTLDLHRAGGCPAATYLPLAYLPQFDGGEITAQYRSDICFIGTPFRASTRVRWLDEAADFLSRYRVRLIGSHVLSESWAQNLRHYDQLKEFVTEQFTPWPEASRYMRGARINLNLHRDSYGQPIDQNEGKVTAQSPNDRTFFLAGLGAFQLVDASRPDLGKLYEPGREVIVVGSVAEMKEKIEYYLRDEAARQAVMAAAQKRTLAEHTYRHRARAILAALR
ncbi:MAG: glycosyltransferase [Candidatus Margulisbacteria bacterium]|jgi:spore maturation protein CgeB|nr:glycosyltransferase [Candidatus Margulisiibacteriota bacterium]